MTTKKNEQKKFLDIYNENLIKIFENLIKKLKSCHQIRNKMKFHEKLFMIF